MTFCVFWPRDLVHTLLTLESDALCMTTAEIIVLYPIKLLPMTKHVNYGKIMFIFTLHTKWFKRSEAKPKCALERPARSNTSSIFKMHLKTQLYVQTCMWRDYLITFLIFFLHILLCIVSVYSTYILVLGFFICRSFLFVFLALFVDAFNLFCMQRNLTMCIFK